MAKTFASQLALQERRARVIYVGSYIPRECGIATFTKDLTSAINGLNPNDLAEILAIDEPGGEEREYPWEVKYRIKQDELESFLAAADYINQSSADLVNIQHEFGLFGGDKGDYILPFVKKINKPIVTTFHTVLEKPGERRLKIVQELATKSQAILVMIGAAEKRLRKVYKIPASKIVVIPHGVPDIPYGPTCYHKQELHLKNNIVISTFGLINPGKGIENAILALPTVVKKYPNVKYLVLGQTHPTLVKKFGEAYRNNLKQIVKDLGLQKNVHFENRYLTLDELVLYLRATDVYVTPYLDPQQITSGTLAYAVGSGRPCISTDYLYAKEVLSKGRGMIVPLLKPEAIAEAILYLLDNPEERRKIERKAYLYGRTMIWSNVALKHLDLFQLILQSQKTGRTNEAHQPA